MSTTDVICAVASLALVVYDHGMLRLPRLVRPVSYERPPALTFDQEVRRRRRAAGVLRLIPPSRSRIYAATDRSGCYYS